MLIRETQEHKDLVEIRDYLLSKDFMLRDEGQDFDGRITSGTQEADVIHRIQEKFDIDVPPQKERSWYDFRYNNTYTNIKITNGTAADNLSSKEGLYYSLCGSIYSGKNDWEMFLKLLSENMKPNDKDYFYLVIFKNQCQNSVLATSLKGLRVLTPNGNNLPFQAHWGNNVEYVDRDYSASQVFILKALYESIKKRASALEHFERYFRDFIGDTL